METHAQMMTAAQFDALAELLRLRGSASTRAARLVLVDGMDKHVAAGHQGITTHALRQCLVRCQKGHTLARVVAGVESGQKTGEAT